MITNMVKYSVGLPVDDVKQESYNGFWAEIVLHSNQPGVLKKLWISDDIKNNIIECNLWVKEGTKIGGFEAANEAIGTLILKFDTQEEVDDVLGNQKKYVNIEMVK